MHGRFGWDWFLDVGHPVETPPTKVVGHTLVSFAINCPLSPFFGPPHSEKNTSEFQGQFRFMGTASAVPQ